MHKKLDKKDIDILWQLFQNSRQPLVSIAKKVRLPKETVKYRMDRLQETNVLNKCYALTDVSQFGLRFYNVFIKLRAIPPDYEQACMNKLKDFPYTAWLISTSGRFSLGCSFLTINRSQFYECWTYIRKLFRPYMKELQLYLNMEGQHFDYPFFKDKKALPVRTASREIDNVQLDDLNKNILLELTENARAPIGHLAQKLDTSSKTVRARIKKLEQKRLISRYSCLLHPGRAGYFFYLVLIRVGFPNQKLDMYLRRIPELFYLCRGVGFFDIKVEFYTKTEQRMHEIEEEMYREFKDPHMHIDVLHVKHEFVARYFVDAWKHTQP